MTEGDIQREKAYRIAERIGLSGFSADRQEPPSVNDMAHEEADQWEENFRSQQSKKPSHTSHENPL